MKHLSLFTGIGGIWYNPSMPSGAKPKIYDHELVERVRIAYDNGATQTEIATAEGLTQKIIWKLMKRHGLTARVAAKRDQQGSKNHMWKGGDASYKAFHQRMYKSKGQPKTCEVCGSTGGRKTYDWANLTGKYDDPKDYKRMCRSCHSKYDIKHLNLKGAVGGRPSCQKAS